jgi:hypothetical protein
MTLERTRELFGIMHVPDMKWMCVGEEEVSLSHSSAIAVTLEEEEVPVPLGPPIAVPLEEGEAKRTRGLIVMVNDEAPILPLVISSPFHFSQNCRRFFSPFPSLDRFVG